MLVIILSLERMSRVCDGLDTNLAAPETGASEGGTASAAAPLGGVAGASVEQRAAYARAEDGRAAVRAARARLAAVANAGDAAAAALAAALSAAEAALATAEAAALAAFAGQGGGPCAYTRLGEALIDVLADVAAEGFAAELAPARFLCNETFEIREPGAVADVLRNALEAQCGATAARAARRERAELPTGDGERDTIRGTTQLIRAAARGEDARVRALVALGAPRAFADRNAGDDFDERVPLLYTSEEERRCWSAAAWARANGCQRALEALLVIPSPYVVSTLAGSGVLGFADGASAAAQFNNPDALAPLPDGSVVVADTYNHCIRLIAAGGGAVSTLAGKGGEEGFADGPAASALFFYPRGVVVCADGAIFVADSGNNRVRRIKDGAVTTFAGSGEVGRDDGVGAAASFYCPFGLVLGPGGVLHVTETDRFGGSNRVRMISPVGAVTTLAGGGGSSGFADGRGAAARFYCPTGIAVDAAGVVFVADRGNNRIRRITNGVVDTLAGSGERGFADGAGAAAQFNFPNGLALDPTTGHLLVADRYNHRIRAVDPRSGAVSTLAGTGDWGTDDGDAAAASFGGPCGVAVDAQGGILVAEQGNGFIRRLVKA